MHKPESALENEIHKILLNFEIQTEHSIPAKSSNLELINKKRNSPLWDFIVSADNRIKIYESNKIDN